MQVYVERGDRFLDQWRTYFDGSKVCTAYHHPRWKRVIQETFGHPVYRILAMDNSGEVRGIFPCVHMKSLLFGNYLVSMPYFNYGGIAADCPEARDSIVCEAAGLAKELGAQHIEFRQVMPLENGLPARTSKVSMLLELPTDSDALWNQFPSKLRSQIRRPQKEGLTARIGRDEELDGFYRVFSENMRDLGTPVYPRLFFKNILSAFPDDTWVCTVYHGSIPVASGFLVGFRGTMEIPWASSLKKYNQWSPNMLLYWECLRFSCRKGYGFFDFGRSTADEGTYRFKEQWGSKPRQLYWHYWLSNGTAMPELNPKNPKYEMAIRVWKKLPLSLTRWIGPHIVKNIP